jgi:hypothetical protein
METKVHKVLDAYRPFPERELYDLDDISGDNLLEHFLKTISEFLLNDDSQRAVTIACSNIRRQRARGLSVAVLSDHNVSMFSGNIVRYDGHIQHRYILKESDIIVDFRTPDVSLLVANHNFQYSNGILSVQQSLSPTNPNGNNTSDDGQEFESTPAPRPESMVPYTIVNDQIMFKHPFLFPSVSVNLLFCIISNNKFCIYVI